jgi:hypothetical protein
MSTDQTSPWVTKEGVEVKIGQVWRDLDKRMRGRCVQVVEFGTITFVGKVRVQGYGRITGASGTKRWLSVARMHRHSTGFELVETIECATMARAPNIFAAMLPSRKAPGNRAKRSAVRRCNCSGGFRLLNADALLLGLTDRESPQESR